MAEVPCYENPGISGKDASFLGDINNAGDRANQDRYLAGEFRGLAVQAAENATSAQKDRNDDTRWNCGEFGSVKAELGGIAKSLCDVNTNVLSVEARLARDIVAGDHRSELAVEKTAAATALAIEKSAAASMLEATKNGAATLAAIAECCCEQKMLAQQNLTLVLADGQKTRDLISQIDRERLQARLAVLEARFPVAA